MLIKLCQIKQNVLRCHNKGIVIGNDSMLQFIHGPRNYHNNENDNSLIFNFTT